MKERIPDLMEHPVYKAAWDRLMMVRAELAATDAEIGGAVAALTQRRADDTQRAAIEAVLNGQEPPRYENIGESLDRLRERRRLLAKAEGVQAERLKAVQAVVSEEICATLRPALQALYARIHLTAGKLQTLLTEEQAFYDALRDAGVHTGALPRCRLRLHGRPESVPDDFERFFTELAHDWNIN